MLKINVGLSRKVSQDYQSKGFSLNIEGELPSEVLTDRAALTEATNSLFAAANQLLDEQVENAAAGESAPKGRRNSSFTDNRAQNGPGRPPLRSNGYRQNGGNGNGHNGNGPTPTNGNIGNGDRLLTQAQSRAIGNMARKLGQDPDQWVRDEFGVNGVRELTIKEASQAIDSLKQSIEKVGVG